ncbi:MAG TPA: alkaline phosphatase family protein [Blastocatellia bacterium]|nr:alkaline phosphatase family protein [Blastocatellia bacterium]
MKKRVMVIGLDCATPQLVFERWRNDLPNLRSLMEAGIWGKLRSSDPPITVPAWMSMMTSKDPGRLGFYGLRNRVDYSYEKMATANSTFVKEPTVWDILSERGKRVILIGVPQTYPPRPVNGEMVTCFLTPSTDKQFTYPASFKEEVQRVTGGYILDAVGFRVDEDEKDRVLKTIYEMTEKRFKLARHMVETRADWDFFMMVEMGPDRIHHMFWKYTDPEHPKYVPGNKYEESIHDYYKFVDAQIGDLLAMAGEETAVLVVSDHGARGMVGGICFNEWLMREGYLVLKNRPEKAVPVEQCDVDWSRTRAWGSGGYYARLMINVKGREPQGIVEPGEEYERVRTGLVEKLAALRDHKGEPMHTFAVRPEDVYREVRGVPPDLFVYFGNLSWRSVGSVWPSEPDSVYTFENDTGPDDANHDWHGIFIMRDGAGNGSLEGQGMNLKDVAPTVLSLLGEEVPGDMEGKVINRESVQ